LACTTPFGVEPRWCDRTVISFLLAILDLVECISKGGSSAKKGEGSFGLKALLWL
jgi:hypothetical protein